MADIYMPMLREWSDKLHDGVAEGTAGDTGVTGERVSTREGRG